MIIQILLNIYFPNRAHFNEHIYLSYLTGYNSLLLRAHSIAYNNTWELNWKPKIPKKNQPAEARLSLHAMHDCMLWDPLWHVGTGTYMSSDTGQKGYPL